MVTVVITILCTYIFLVPLSDDANDDNSDDDADSTSTNADATTDGTYVCGNMYNTYVDICTFSYMEDGWDIVN